MIVIIILACSNSIFADVSMGFKCGKSIITVDKKNISQIFASGDVDKYKITNINESYVAASWKSKSTKYDVLLDLDDKTLTVNSKDLKTGIIGSYSKDCH